MRKCTNKFLRMKLYLKRVMSGASTYSYRQKLNDWRECQELVMCGFEITGTGDKGTYFNISGLNLSEVLQDDLKKGMYESGN